MKLEEQTTFIEINPGLGSSGFAAEAAGMLRLGPLLVSEDVRAQYLAFHGHGSLDPVGEQADFVVADLPFAMFLNPGNPDPEVGDVLAAASRSVKKKGVVLFRVKWDMALRLRQTPDDYREVVERQFPKRHVDSFVDTSGGSVVTNDLYVVVTPKPLKAPPRIWEQETAAIHPVVLSQPGLDEVDPQLILDALGFPEHFHRTVGSVPHVHDRLRECAPVFRARALMEDLLGSGRS